MWYILIFMEESLPQLLDLSIREIQHVSVLGRADARLVEPKDDIDDTLSKALQIFSISFQCPTILLFLQICITI